MPLWFTVIACPAMVITPLRASGLALGATLKFTVAAPLPALVFRLIQAAFVEATHGQAALDGMTSTEPAPPAAGCTGKLAPSVNVQANPACVTV